MDELISIVVPVYNVEQYLDTCMTSILGQSYCNLEIILVDDGSTDSSGKICDRYLMQDKRVKVIHKKNGGLSDARNKGISAASGMYILFVDSDDVISFDLVEYLYTLLKGACADIAICDPVHCNPDQEIVFEKKTEEKIFAPEEAIIEMLYQKSFLVSAWGKLFKKAIFKDISFPYGMLFEDSAIMYRVFENADKIVYGNARLYGYMHREGSITTKKFSDKDLDILKICDELNEYVSNRNEALKKAARAYCVNANLRILLTAEPYEEYKSIVKKSQQQVRKNWSKVFFDKNIRWKLRASLVLFLFGKLPMKFVHSRINRWK